MKPLVSILIPVYNAEQWLAEALESTLAQTWQNKEIIVVNDGSTDSTLAVARQFKSYGVQVISQENKGASAARNCAFREAEGDFIQYLDADDLLAPDKIELQIRRLSSEPPDRIAAGAWGRFYDSSHNAEFIPEPVWSDLSPVDWLVTSWCGGGMMHTAAWLTPRSIAEKVGGWDETPCPNDDGEYFTRVLLSSSGVSFCQEARSYYRSGILESLGGCRKLEMLASTYRSLELCANHLLTKEDSPRSRKACAANFQRFIYAVYPDMPNLVQKAEAKVQSLGGSHLKPDGGPLFQFFANTVDWKLAKRIQRLSYSLNS